MFFTAETGDWMFFFVVFFVELFRVFISKLVMDFKSDFHFEYNYLKTYFFFLRFL